MPLNGQEMLNTIVTVAAAFAKIGMRDEVRVRIRSRSGLYDEVDVLFALCLRNMITTNNLGMTEHESCNKVNCSAPCCVVLHLANEFLISLNSPMQASARNV